MRASRAQFLQTRFDSHVDLGCIFFEKARTRRFPYAWMARMQFDKAARHSPHRADEIATFYAVQGSAAVAVDFFQTRLKDASCNHDPAAWSQLGSALQSQAAGLRPTSRKAARVQTRAQAAFDKAAALSQPAARPERPSLAQLPLGASAQLALPLAP